MVSIDSSLFANNSGSAGGAAVVCPCFISMPQFMLRYLQLLMSAAPCAAQLVSMLSLNYCSISQPATSHWLTSTCFALVVTLSLVGRPDFGFSPPGFVVDLAIMFVAVHMQVLGVSSLSMTRSTFQGNTNSQAQACLPPAL